MHADDPASGHVTYSFTDHAHRLYGHLFSIDSESGAVRTRSRLDYEQSRAHYLTVVATDRRSPTSLPVSAKVRYDTIRESEFLRELTSIRDRVLCLPSVFCQSDIAALIEHVCVS